MSTESLHCRIPFGREQHSVREHTRNVDMNRRLSAEQHSRPVDLSIANLFDLTNRNIAWPSEVIKPRLFSMEYEVESTHF